MPRRLALFGGFVLVALVTRAAFIGVPCLDLDEAAQLTVARELARGATLYVDVADNRPPLLYLLYAAAPLAGGGLPGVRLLTALLVLPLTAFGASAFFRHDRRGALAGLLYLVYGAAYLAHDMHAVSPELLMLLPLSAALALARDGEPAQPRRLIAQGVLVGLAALVRQHAVLWLPALALAAWSADSGRRSSDAERAGRLALIGAGFLLPLAVCLLVFAALGALPELVFWTWTHNLEYARNPLPATEALARAASTLGPFLIVTVPLWWGAWRSRPQLGRSWGVLVLAVAGSLAGAVLGLRFFPHYLVPLYLPLAIAAAPATLEAIEGRSRAGRLAVAWPLVALAGFTVANLALYSGRYRVYEETRPVFRQVAERLHADPCRAAGPLFVWGFAPQLYVESGMRPASRYVMPQAPLVAYEPGNRASRSAPPDPTLARPEHQERLLADLARSRPAFVLDTAPSGLHGWDRHPLGELPGLEAFVHEGYDAVADVDGVWVWRRRGCEAAAPRP
jgi:4-amino-4-deoxy-L-arabinose transferase-like glycosyltransferase